MRGTALQLYRCVEMCGPFEALRCERQIDEWVEKLVSFSPSGRLEIVQALNASREMLEITCPVKLAGVHSILLLAARAVRNRDNSAAHLLRALPSLAQEGTAAHAAFSMVARGARPALVTDTRARSAT